MLRDSRRRLFQPHTNVRKRDIPGQHKGAARVPVRPHAEHMNSDNVRYGLILGIPHGSVDSARHSYIDGGTDLKSS